jgi:hypothetical protein
MKSDGFFIKRLDFLKEEKIKERTLSIDIVKTKKRKKFYS